MVGHGVNGDQFLALARDDAGDVFVQFLLAFGTNQILPALDREYDLQVNLE